MQVAYRSGSVRLRLFFTKTVASLAYRLSKNKSRLSEKNVCNAFQHKLSPERCRAIVKGSFYQFWSDTVSMPYRGGSEAAVRPVCVYGLEHLQDSIEERQWRYLMGERLLRSQKSLETYPVPKRFFPRSGACRWPYGAIRGK
jgi:hypothetical protein